LSRSTVKAVLRPALAVLGAAVLAPFAVGGQGNIADPAVVVVRAWSAGGVAERATGTVTGAGEVLTVDHLLAGAERIEVQGRDGVRRRATVLRRRPALDLAVLRVPAVKGPPVRFGRPAGALRVIGVREGAPWIAPAALRRSVVARLVDQPGRPRRPSLDLAVAVAAGDSGAPVLDDRGAVVGVVYARSTRRDGRAYAVTGAAARRVAR
jgi:S1-C subfamily serine protease